ncbi:MAG: hypothetical protein V4525_14455 [Pseudomonadota bacterium]
MIKRGRNTKAAKRLLYILIKKQGRAPRVLVTDKLKSYGAATIYSTTLMSATICLSTIRLYIDSISITCIIFE